MSVIHITKRHKLGYTRARTKAEDLVSRLKSDFDADYRWEKEDLRFSSRGVEGRIHIGEHEVDVRIRLGILLRPMKSRIENAIEARLEEILGEGSKPG
jgi:putative polyhydroxyalkanoate system protein